MRRFTVGDRVRIDIPDATDPDHDRYHRRKGAITAVLEDDAPAETGDERDAVIYRVEFDDSHMAEFRWRDLRPACGDER